MEAYKKAAKNIIMSAFGIDDDDDSILITHDYLYVWLNRTNLKAEDVAKLLKIHDPRISKISIMIPYGAVFKGFIGNGI